MTATLAVKQSILDLLQDFCGPRPLKQLFWTELNYDQANRPLTRRNWPESVQRLLSEEPLLLATAGADDDFHVIYCRLASPVLRVTEERAVIEQLLRAHPYALFVFSNQAQDHWHFVNVKVAAPRTADGDGAVAPDADQRDSRRRRLFRRITVAPGELLRTGAERLAKIDVAQLPAGASALAIQERHDEAFDVEAVTKAFYRRYAEVFEQVEKSITGFGNDAERKRLFTQHLFNRLMFLAFVQKKGWLVFDGRTDYLHALWADYQRLHKAEPNEDHNFYRDRLEILFFSALNSERDVAGINRGGALSHLIGEVPYLNGGLFERDDLDRTKGIAVPDGAIRRIVHDLFGSFNFTVSEATPLDVEVAVDPEMLGKVFEELVTGRHESGSYYTPKPIVSFMCREALKGYLQSAVPGESGEAITRFVDEHDAGKLRNGEAVLQSLREVRACDPACGSGAYLLGMLHELLELRAALFATRKLDRASIYERKLEIIQQNVYGVDLDPFAVNIARLRLWLSLVVDFEPEPGEPIPPLPNLDFKIGEGDSLAAPGVGQLELAAVETVEAFERAKREYLTAHHGQKRVAREEVERLRKELTAWMHGGKPVEGFDWWVDFAEVFAERRAPATLSGELNLGDELAANRPGGFDIVLANPPYVRQELIRDQKPRLQKNFPEVYTGTADLYVFFYARALELLAQGGMLVFITPNKWFRAAYGKKLRKYVGTNTRVDSITDFGDLPVFESATAYPMIFIAQKGAPTKGAAGPIFTEPKSLEPPYPDVRALINATGSRLPADSVSGDEWRLTDSATAAMLKQMKKDSIPLGEYVKGRIYYGVKTGLNEAFVIDGATRAALIQQDAKSAEVIKRLVVGRDIHRWTVDYADRWLIFTRRGVQIRQYPAIERYLERFRVQLEPRPRTWLAGKKWPGRKPGTYRWYEIQDEVAYHSVFAEPKIIYPVISRGPTFAYDRKGAFTNDKAFVIPTVDLSLIGILNSQTTWQAIQAICSPLQGGFHEMRAVHLAQIPIPRATPADRDAIAELAQKCLDAGGTGPEVAELEAEIDDRVAVLYGLEAAPAAAGAGG